MIIELLMPQFAADAMDLLIAVKGGSMRHAAVAVITIFLSIMSASNMYAGEVIDNASLGFKVELPDGWFRAPNDQVFRDLEHTKYETEQIRDFLRKHLKTPTLLATKFQEPFADVNPSLKINVFPYKSSQKMEALELAERNQQFYRKVLADFQLLMPPQKIKLAERDAAYFKAQHVSRVDSGDLPIISEAWFVSAEEYYFFIVASYRPDGKTGERTEAVKAIEGMTITAK